MAVVFINGQNIDTNTGKVVSEEQIAEANAPADTANFKDLTGRDPTEFELQWAKGTDPVQHFGSSAKALKWQASRIAEVSRKIQSTAKASGLTLSPQEANQLRDQYMPATGSSSDTEINEALNLALSDIGNRKTEGLVKSLTGEAGGTTAPVANEQDNARARAIIEQAYGRQATDNEVNYIAKEMLGGMDPYEVEQFLQTTQEYMKRQASIENERVKQEEQAARGELDKQLQASGQEVFARATPQIISQYQKAGRIGSSGLTNALAKAQADIDKERQLYLANAGYDAAIRREGYGRENFVNTNAQAFNQYLRQSEPGYQQQFNLQNIGNQLRYQQPFAALERQYTIQDRRTERGYGMEDYNLQKNDWREALSAQTKNNREAALWQLGGQVLGSAAQAGAMYYGAKR